MPVSFLRTPADYLGISEAPPKPLFQQTNALQQGADDAMGFFNQMVGLRQQRPLAQAQAIQNQYSTIFNNAEKLRLEQQAAKEAEQAVSALAGLTPEVDDYVAQRQEIQRQFPNAMLDPRVQRIVDDNDRMFTSRQSALAKQQQEAADRRAKLFGMGATPQQVEAVFQNPDAAAQLEFQLGKETSGKGSATALKSAVDLLNDEIKAMSEAGEDYEMVGEQQVMKPEYKALLDRRNKYRDAYLGELDKVVFPQQAATAAKEVEKTVVPPAATYEGKAPAVVAPTQIDINTQVESLPFAQQKAFLEKKNAEEAAQKAIAPAWEKAKTDIEKQILKIVPDKPLPGTKVNELESFAKAVLNPNENIITHPEYGTIPVAWDILNRAGVPMADIMTNKTVFRQPGEGRRLFGVIGTQQVGYQELLKEWAKSFLNNRGKLLPTSQSPSGSTLTEQQQKDLDELSSLVRSK